MAHFARIEGGIVREVIKVANDALDPADEESSGQAVIAQSGIDGDWVQCFYSGEPRAYPGEGWAWDGENFTAPEPASTASSV